MRLRPPSGTDRSRGQLPFMAALYEDRFWTSSDGLNLHYRNYPGPEGSRALPVLCLHGLTRNARDFAALAEDLSAKRRVIVPEMRGRGQSDYARDSDSYTPSTYVADVEKLLAEQAITRFVAIGTSMGGLMVMLMAQAQPGRMAAVVLNDIGPEVETAGLARISGYVGQGRSFPTWVHAAKALAETHGAAFPDYTLDQWLDLAKRTMVVTQNGRISFDYDMAIAEPFARPGNAAPPNLWLAFEALAGVPMLLVRGELSDLLSPDTVKRMAARNPKMRTITVPRVGHAPTLDEPEVRAAIQALLDEVA
jgi:pimeloyl-ACP methyl ester carboxylesterase